MKLKADIGSRCNGHRYRALLHVEPTEACMHVLPADTRVLLLVPVAPAATISQHLLLHPRFSAALSAH
jgi:hypothetical protein